MKLSITAFKGKYAFLSNFYPCLIKYENEMYPSVEHAFQAAKSTDPKIRHTIALCPSAAEAKRCGRNLQLRSDWNIVRIDVMRNLLRLKFQTDINRQKLMSTGDAYLEEGNRHGDKFWGTVDGVGENNLGKLLMEIRKEMSNE